MHFYAAAKRAGFQPYVDWDCECGHFATMEIDGTWNLPYVEAAEAKEAELAAVAKKFEATAERPGGTWPLHGRESRCEPRRRRSARVLVHQTAPREFIAIGIPSFGMVHLYFTARLLNLRIPMNTTIRWFYVVGKEVGDARNEIVARARARRPRRTCAARRCSSSTTTCCSTRTS
jgi:hypothetical protein